MHYRCWAKSDIAFVSCACLSFCVLRASGLVSEARILFTYKRIIIAVMALDKTDGD